MMTRAEQAAATLPERIRQLQRRLLAASIAAETTGDWTEADSLRSRITRLERMLSRAESKVARERRARRQAGR